MNDIETRLAELTKRFDEVTSKEMDQRLSTLVAEGISKWELRRGAIVVLVLAVFGVASYTQLNQAIVNYFTSKAAPQIDQEVKVKTASISSQDPAIAELKTRVADLEKLLAQLKPSPTPTPGAPAPVPPPAIAPTPAEGFAFFGVRRASGAWSEKHFLIPGAGERPPQKGDDAVADGSVNVRAGYIVYGESGWTNQRAIGVLRRGEKVKVVEVKEVVEGFWWISYTR
jgi:hypothetical protein